MLVTYAYGHNLWPAGVVDGCGCALAVAGKAADDYGGENLRRWVNPQHLGFVAAVVTVGIT